MATGRQRQRPAGSKFTADLQPFQPADLRDDRRMADYIDGLERTVMELARTVERMQMDVERSAGNNVLAPSSSPSSANASANATNAAPQPQLSLDVLRAIRDALEAGGPVELDLTNLNGVSAENVDVRFQIVTTAPDPTSSPYDAYILSSGGSYSLWQIDRSVNPPVAVQIGLTAGHAVLSATHTDTVAATVVRGDMIVGNATPAWARVAKGTADQVWQMDAAGTDPVWRTFELNGNVDLDGELRISNAVAVDNTISPYTIGAGTTIVAVDTSGGAVTINLPAAVPLYRVFIIYDLIGNAAANNITISGNGNNINGAASVVIATDRAGKWIQGTGSDYNIIGTIVP